MRVFFSQDLSLVHSPEHRPIISVVFFLHKRNNILTRHSFGTWRPNLFIRGEIVFILVMVPIIFLSDLGF
jgi:hypothetical protein